MQLPEKPLIQPSFNNLPSENNVNKKVITIGGYGVDFSVAIKWAVYRFNTSQNEYRVFPDDYWNEYSYDWDLYNMICDEVNAYYYQNKSPEAIAKTFQSRLDLYVSENYK